MLICILSSFSLFVLQGGNLACLNKFSINNAITTLKIWAILKFFYCLIIYVGIFPTFLSGSGKSYLAKILRDFEVENGGTAPRIHSMDEYFMTEVEKVFFPVVLHL